MNLALESLSWMVETGVTLNSSFQTGPFFGFFSETQSNVNTGLNLLLRGLAPIQRNMGTNCPFIRIENRRNDYFFLLFATSPVCRKMQKGTNNWSEPTHTHASRRKWHNCEDNWPWTGFWYPVSLAPSSSAPHTLIPQKKIASLFRSGYIERV